LSLQMLPLSKRKMRCLKETYSDVRAIYLESIAALGSAKSRKQLHEATYHKLRDKYDIASQLVVEATSEAWSKRRNIRKSTPQKAIVRFDRRLFRLARTVRGNPILSIRTNRERIGIPILKDACKRLDEHLKDGWQCSSIVMRNDLNFCAVLSKDLPTARARSNFLGIDVNSARIAVTALSSRKVMKQLYLGQDIATRQFSFEERRAKLQGYRDGKGSRGMSGLKLKQLSGKQRRFVQTRMWMIANEIAKVAKAYKCNIAIERLRNLRKHRGEFGSRSSRKINRIPYGFLRHALQCVCEREGIIFREVSSAYTSQTCPRCGFVSRKNWLGYKMFLCRRCGYQVNRDRLASLNVAIRALAAVPHAAIPKYYVRNQISERNASVSRRVRQNDALKTASTRAELQAPILQTRAADLTLLRVSNVPHPGEQHCL